jgi:peroxiredoxin
MSRCLPRRIASLVFVILALMWIGSSFAAELKIGQKAPNFTLPTIFGDSTYTSKDLFPQSELTVLIFWTSYCPDCWKALKSCRDLATKVKEMGVNVIGINFDTEKLATVRGFIKGEKIDFVNLSDFQVKVARAYKAESYDFSAFIVDRHGALQYVSYDHPPDVDTVILKTVKEILGEDESKEKDREEKSKSKSKESRENKDTKV